MNKDYIDFIRKNTAYPTLRAFLSVMIGVGLLVAGMAAFYIYNEGSSIVAIIVGVVLFLLIKIAVEAALTLADIADSTIERGARDWIRSPEELVKINSESVGEVEKATETRNGVMTCPKCGWANFIDATKCSSCKAEISR